MIKVVRQCMAAATPNTGGACTHVSCCQQAWTSRFIYTYLKDFGGLVPKGAFSEAAPCEAPTAAGAVTAAVGGGAVVAWSLEGAGAGALLDSEAAKDLEEVAPVSLPSVDSTAEVLLDAEGSRSKLSTDASEPLRECLGDLLSRFSSFLSSFFSFFSSCRSRCDCHPSAIMRLISCNISLTT